MNSVDEKLLRYLNGTRDMLNKSAAHIGLFKRIHKTFDKLEAALIQPKAATISMGGEELVLCTREEILFLSWEKDEALKVAREVLTEVKTCLGKDYWGDKPATYQRVIEALTAIAKLEET